MKEKIEKNDCDSCGIVLPVDKLHKFTWRYNDKEKVYITSKLKIIHTGSLLLCKKCLKSRIKKYYEI